LPRFLEDACHLERVRGNQPIFTSKALEVISFGRQKKHHFFEEVWLSFVKGVGVVIRGLFSKLGEEGVEVGFEARDGVASVFRGEIWEVGVKPSELGEMAWSWCTGVQFFEGRSGNGNLLVWGRCGRVQGLQRETGRGDAGFFEQGPPFKGASGKPWARGDVGPELVKV
jgi:hypothetical protein